MLVKNVGGAGAVTFGNGIEVVQVTDPTHSAAGAFTLLGRVVAGPYEYKLNQGGAQSADGNWYLSSEQAPPRLRIHLRHLPPGPAHTTGAAHAALSVGSRGLSG